MECRAERYEMKNDGGKWKATKRGTFLFEFAQSTIVVKEIQENVISSYEMSWTAKDSVCIHNNSGYSCSTISNSIIMEMIWA